MKKLDYSLLNLDETKEQQVRGLINRSIIADDFQSVKTWVAQCYNPPKQHEKIMCALDEVLCGYGIEAIEGEWRNGYWCDIVATYVNMGDTYTPTIVYHRDNGFMITSWGDLVENKENED